MRSGHTRGGGRSAWAVAGTEPVAAICELVNDDGSTMRGKAAAAAFATHHKSEADRGGGFDRLSPGGARSS